MTHSTDCLNCGTHLVDGGHYCHHCGQTAHAHWLDLPHLFHELLHFFTHADKGIFYLVRMLLIRPGIVAREYVRGRRKKYFNPLNFFLIAVGLFVFVRTTFKPMTAVNMAKAKAAVLQNPDRVVRERRMAKLERVEAATNFAAKYSNYINMAVTPLVAFPFFLFFYRSGYNFTEHLVALMYVGGINTLIYIFLITPYLVLTRGKPAYVAGIFVYLGAEVVYRTLGYYQFIQRTGWKHFLHCFFVSLLTVAAWYFFSRGIIVWYMDTGFR